MIWRQIRRSLKLTLIEGKQFIDRHLWLDPENPAVKQYFINLFTKTNNPTFRRLTWISNIFYDTMGNQAIASSAIIKKHDQLRMKLGSLRFMPKSIKALQGKALACKQRENYSN